ncbi:MAG: hypothetical protein KGY38_02640 [Desulfobacterales bacterium]|nr:hypothetical protein [Desulfobacterales bacterium]
MTDSRLLLFFPFSRLPGEAGEMLERLSAASGIAPGDLRYKLVGQGLSRLTPELEADRQDACLAEMKSLGIPAALVPAEKTEYRKKLPVARKVEISDHAAVFFDRHDNAVFKVDHDTDLLVILTDLSGKAIEKPHLALQFHRHPAQKSFEEALKKFSVCQPAAIFAPAGGPSPAGVLVDHSIFAYRSLQQHMGMSASVNFRTLVTKTIEKAKTCVTDHKFGNASIARAMPEWNAGKTDILAAFNRYALFLMAAAGAGLLKDGAPVSADDSYALKTGDGPEKETKPRAAGSEKSKSGGPLPPPEIRHSGIAGIINAAPSETIFGAVFGLIIFMRIFFGTGEISHPVFWKTAACGVLTGTGFLIFSYSLLLVYYRRMVKNIPTSRVRSVAMGMAELEGRAGQYYDLRSAHSNTRCIYYRCVYYRRVRTLKDSKWRLQKIVNSGKLPFYLQDDTGRILIRPKGALFLTEKSHQEFWGGQQILLSPQLQDRDTRIYEDIITEGSRIYVLGSARTERIGQTFKEKLVSRLRELKSNPGELMKYDADKNGRIDETEWETARTDMENVVYAEALGSDNAARERAVIRKPAYGMLPFIIADSESAIIRKLSLRIWLFLAGGLLMAGLGTEMLIRLHAG